jgi:hypothetical protein
MSRGSCLTSPWGKGESELPHQFEVLANVPESGEELSPMTFSGEINLAI